MWHCETGGTRLIVNANRQACLYRGNRPWGCSAGKNHPATPARIRPRTALAAAQPALQEGQAGPEPLAGLTAPAAVAAATTSSPSPRKPSAGLITQKPRMTP